MNRQFTRRVEDFTCANCGAHNSGNGYTNHCSQCLYSLHVDIHPGDRAHECKGLLEPVSVVYEKSRYTIEHRCVRCGQHMRCKASPADNIDRLHEIMAKRAQEFW